MPAYNVVYDASDPRKVVSFSLTPSPHSEAKERTLDVINAEDLGLSGKGARENVCGAQADLVATDETLKSMKAF